MCRCKCIVSMRVSARGKRGCSSEGGWDHGMSKDLCKILHQFMPSIRSDQGPKVQVDGYPRMQNARDIV